MGEEHVFPVWLTEKSVAKMTGVSVSTLQKQRFHKVGVKSVRYSFQDVMDYMEAQKIETDL